MSAQQERKVSLTTYREQHNLPPTRLVKPKKSSDSADTLALQLEYQRTLQLQCVEWAERNTEQYSYLDLMLHPANGNGRTRAETEKLRATGAQKGAPRLIIPTPNKPARKRYSGLAIEIKHATGALSAEQEEWCQRLKDSGYLYAVVRSLEDFIAAVREFHQVDA